MDLGFGSANQAVGNNIANAILQSTQVQERVIENELNEYDNILNDDYAIEELRKKRILEMKKRKEIQQKYVTLGHGKYDDIHDLSGQSVQGNVKDVTKTFFNICKESQFVIVHFYRTSSSNLCNVFHKHLNILCKKHMETKFVKINVENCDQKNDSNSASYLVSKLGIIIMPTLVLVKDRKVIHHVRGFDELGNSDSFSTNALAYLLYKYGVFNSIKDDEYHDEEEFYDEISELHKYNTGINSINIHKY